MLARCQQLRLACWFPIFTDVCCDLRNSQGVRSSFIFVCTASEHYISHSHLQHPLTVLNQLTHTLYLNGISEVHFLLFFSHVQSNLWLAMQTISPGGNQSAQWKPPTIPGLWKLSLMHIFWTCDSFEDNLRMKYKFTKCLEKKDRLTFDQSFPFK